MSTKSRVHHVHIIYSVPCEASAVLPLACPTLADLCPPRLPQGHRRGQSRSSFCLVIFSSCPTSPGVTLRGQVLRPLSSPSTFPHGQVLLPLTWAPVGPTRACAMCPRHLPISLNLSIPFLGCVSPTAVSLAVWMWPSCLGFPETYWGVG